MPTSTLRMLDKVKERYEEDLKVLITVLVRLLDSWTYDGDDADADSRLKMNFTRNNQSIQSLSTTIRSFGLGLMVIPSLSRPNTAC